MATGAKLAYAAPLVAVTMKLTATGALAGKPDKPVQCCQGKYLDHKGDQHNEVGICHKVNGQGELGNGFDFICVDDDSVKYQGHLQHSTDAQHIGELIGVKCSDECVGDGTVQSLP